jgi:hypothetical protein
VDCQFSCRHDDAAAPDTHHGPAPPVRRGGPGNSLAEWEDNLATRETELNEWSMHAIDTEAEAEAEAAGQRYGFPADSPVVHARLILTRQLFAAVWPADDSRDLARIVDLAVYTCNALAMWADSLTIRDAELDAWCMHVMNTEVRIAEAAGQRYGYRDLPAQAQTQASDDSAVVQARLAPWPM